MNTQGAFAIVNRDGRVLLVRLPEWTRFGGHWNFPGGVVDAGESLEGAAAREVLEETGISCEIGEVVAKVAASPHNIAVTIFAAEYVTGDIVLQEEEVTDADWFSIGDALELPLAYDIRSILEGLDESAA